MSRPVQGGEGGTVQLAHRTDDRVDDVGPFGAVTGAHRQRPFPRGVVEPGLGHLRREADALAQPQLLAHPLQVGQQIRLRREARHPVVGLGEGEAVELVRHVDTAARVDVLEPGAADVRVLLVDHDLHARLAQPVRRRQARGARADHGAAEATAHVVEVPRGPPGIGPLEGQLLHQEGLPLLRGVRTHEKVEHTPQLVLGQRLLGARTLVGQQSVSGQPPGRLLLLGGEAASGDEELALIGRQLRAQQGQVARPVRHRAQQGVHVGRGERRLDPRRVGHAR